MHDEVIAALETLPKAALLSYAEAITVLELTPHVGRPLNPARPDGIKELLFADGRGAILYLVLEHVVEAHMLELQFLG
ncbi:hypothetical protein JOF53_004634 [Crossiella equi]|uniref:Uncharacterized protein n=1 Tax=Crossiella equi TaxID=130796 RepID=A0ABS5AGS5_9PSEU|nr:hypothetical protein [Crossiella equi]MBP2475762.1 hypothetical protein [Crossiella equi]